VLGIEPRTSGFAARNSWPLICVILKCYMFYIWRLYHTKWISETK
jgi:hypothetical protein